LTVASGGTVDRGELVGRVAGVFKFIVLARADAELAGA
jgi:hypothetical protein